MSLIEILADVFHIEWKEKKSNIVFEITKKININLI